MNKTREAIIKAITDELDDCLESHNAEIHDWKDKVVELDEKAQTITLKFSYNIVEEDNYIGLAFY
jgi:hypothetical protein